jgi:archaeosine synthase alpha-subunit
VSRTVERTEGLSLVGGATLGGVSFATPALLESRLEGEMGPGLSLRALPAPTGKRGFEIADAAAHFAVEVPILAPEIGGEGPGVYPIGPGAFLVHPPFSPDAARAARTERPELIVLGNARALWSDGRSFVRGVRDVREAFGAAPLLWTPRVALPHRIALLAYLGIDLVDTTEAHLVAAQGVFLDSVLGPRTPAPAPFERACDCAACSSTPVGSLASHAVTACQRAMAETVAAARGGRLRELVEARLVAEPALAEMLRYADRDLRTLLDERTPVASVGSHDYVLLESHRRPEMVRFRSRLLERYRPPSSKTVLLLVPCSKTKPYRRSRSHRRFWGALEGLSPLERVHVVSVSSPIGLVPRELEDVPPARHYDIPVTGEWEESERGYVRSALAHLRARGNYRATVVHLDPEEYSFLASDLPPSETIRWTVKDERTTTNEAVAELRSALAQALESERPVEGGPLSVVREELEALAGVQFGPDAARRLFAPPVRLSGRPWFQRVTDGRADLATWREERGLFHLTVAGARRLWPDPPLAVEVDSGVPLEGDLFVPGVRSADERIRAGDAVVLVRDGRLAAVGEAALPGRLMTELSRGLAVRVRHREHAPTDSPMTEERSPSDAGPVV